MMAPMDPRALERLGHHIVSRRLALGFRNRTDLVDSLQFTVRTLADIEHGRPVWCRAYRDCSADG